MQRLNCSLDEVSYSIVHTLLCPAMGVNSVVAVPLDIMPALQHYATCGWMTESRTIDGDNLSTNHAVGRTV